MKDRPDCSKTEHAVLWFEGQKADLPRIQKVDNPEQAQILHDEIVSRGDQMDWSFHPKILVREIPDWTEL